MSGVKNGVVLVLLVLNALMELGGGGMMIARPLELGRDTFGLAVGAEAASLVALIGGATLSYALLSAVAAVGVLQRRSWARLLVGLLGAMLAIVGSVMLASGMRIGAFDLAKGVIFVLGAWLLERRVVTGVGVPLPET
jgi:hypothetical protein